MPTTVSFDTIGYFRTTLTSLTPPLLRVTLEAMLLGLEDASTPQSVACYEARIMACHDEFESRGMSWEHEPVPPARDALDLAVLTSHLSLTPEQIIEVRARYERGETYATIAEALSVSTKVISCAIKGTGSYGHI
jgi:DNA-directed RNA polymerase specialized sigma24 family protein